MGDGEHGGGYEPGQAHDGANPQHYRHHQQVQMVATAFLHDGEEGGNEGGKEEDKKPF